MRLGRRVVYPCLAGDPQEACRDPERESQREPDPYIGEGAKQHEQRGRREYRPQHQQGGPTDPHQPRGERSDGEDRDEVGAGVEPDEGLVDALVAEHQREQRHREPVAQARDRERDGGDDELPPARVPHGYRERFGHPGTRHGAGRRRGLSACGGWVRSSLVLPIRTHGIRCPFHREAKAHGYPGIKDIEATSVGQMMPVVSVQCATAESRAVRAPSCPWVSRPDDSHAQSAKADASCGPNRGQPREFKASPEGRVAPRPIQTNPDTRQSDRRHCACRQALSCTDGESLSGREFASDACVEHGEIGRDAGVKP